MAQLCLWPDPIEVPFLHTVCAQDWAGPGWTGRSSPCHGALCRDVGTSEDTARWVKELYGCAAQDAGGAWQPLSLLGIYSAGTYGIRRMGFRRSCYYPTPRPACGSTLLRAAAQGRTWKDWFPGTARDMQVMKQLQAFQASTVRYWATHNECATCKERCVHMGVVGRRSGALIGSTHSAPCLALPMLGTCSAERAQEHAVAWSSRVVMALPTCRNLGLAWLSSFIFPVPSAYQ